MQESDKRQPPKLTNATKYQPIPLFSTAVKSVRHFKEKMESRIIDFKLQTASIKSD